MWVYICVYKNKEKEAMNLRMAEAWDWDKRRYLGRNGGRKQNKVYNSISIKTCLKQVQNSEITDKI